MNELRRRMKARTDKPVSESERIAALPRVTLPTLERDFDRKYLRPTANPKAELRHVQRLALWTIETVGGLIGPIGTGWGKGLISMLAARSAMSLRPLLLLPASMLNSGSFRREHAKFMRDWRIPIDLSVCSYEQLSQASSNRYLDTIRPDFIVCDEAHKLRHHTSARVKRLARYMKANPTTRCAFISGTMTKRSVRDYAHLAEWALGAGSPLPREWVPLEAFADCLDASGKPPDPASFGFMRALGLDLRDVEYGTGGDGYREVARAVYLDLFENIAGIVATSDASVDASLSIDARPLEMPAVVEEALAKLYATWKRPDGEELATPMHVAGVESCLRSGFYYRWIWPDGKPDRDWLEARADWARSCRRLLSRGFAAFDSPLLIANGLRSGALHDTTALRHLDRWTEEREKPEPPKEPVWISDHMIEDACAWACDELDAGRRGIVWFKHRALGDALEAAGLPTFRAGDDPESSRSPIIACSIQAHSDGKNLQGDAENNVPGWHSNLVLNWSRSGDVMEQLISRTHRALQVEDEVSVTLYAHCREQFKLSHADARYIEGTTKTRQRLLYADLTDAAAALLKEDES